MHAPRKTWLGTIAALAALLSLAACSGGNTPTEPTPTADQSIDLSGLVITLNRIDHCWGLACPNYTITIREDGSVEYEGDHSVDIEGIRRSRIETADVRRLVQRLDESGFFDLPPSSACSWSDMPVTSISVKLGDLAQTVIHCSLPVSQTLQLADLRRIEIVLEDLVNAEGWVGPRIAMHQPSQYRLEIDASK